MSIALSYTPQEKQLFLHETVCRQILYGGAAGGGKSHCLRWDAIYWCLMIPGLQAYLFRRSYQELYDNHIKVIQASIPKKIGAYNDTRKAFELRNGSTIFFRYCEHENDVHNYQGSEIHWLGVDEAAHLTGFQLAYLFGRNRLGEFAEKIPEKWRPLFPRAVYGSNPGGPGHGYLKERFVTASKPMTRFIGSDGFSRIFIPATMADNRFIDSDYDRQFDDLPPEMARALREGDWDAVVGQAVPIYREKHLLRDFVPPRHWTRFMCLDWGTAKPYSVGWYCVSDGAFLSSKEGFSEVYIPSGAVIRYAELYGWSGQADKGTRENAGAVAQKIRRSEEERNEPPMDYRIGDSQMWASDGGPSPAERMISEGIMLRRSEKDRHRNYHEILARLHGEEFGEEEVRLPMFYVTQGCRHFWRTVPGLLLDETTPDKGPGERQEDHVYDEVAYALRSRPYAMTEEDRDRIERERAIGTMKPRGRYAV